MPDRRGRGRMSIHLPVRVRGRDLSGGNWEEVSASVDASVSGLAILVEHAVQTGQVLQLSVPLPSRLRQYDLEDASYHVYGLVRRAEPFGSRARVGVLFIGPTLPRGYNAVPSGLFHLPSDRTSAATTLVLRMDLVLDTTGRSERACRHEQAVVERLSETSAIVYVEQLPVRRGSFVTLAEVDGRYRTPTEVTEISVEDDGQARIVLRILGPSPPSRLLNRARPREH